MARTPRPIPLSELGAFLGIEIEGDPSVEIAGFASLVSAGPDDLVFVRTPAQSAALASSKAIACVAPAGVDASGRPVLRSAVPAHAFSQLIEHFAPRSRPPVGVAQGAHVDPTAEIDSSAAVEPGARVGPGCRVGPRSVIAANASLGSDVVVGADVWIHASAVLREDTKLGDRVVVQSGAVLGGEGFGLVPDAEGRPVAMAQRGRVVVEDDVEIGANTTIDRATLDETRIRRGAKIDSQVHIAHNCEIGEDVLIAAQTGLSGGTIVGAGAILMGGVGTTGHLRIGEGAFIAARAGLHHDVPPGARMYGAPATEERSWHRTVAALRRLPELIKRVRRLERTLDSAGSAPAGGKSAPSAGDSGAD